MAWRAGVSKVDITPPYPVYMAGYGNRTQKHNEVRGTRSSQQQACLTRSSEPWQGAH